MALEPPVDLDVVAGAGKAKFEILEEAHEKSEARQDQLHCMA